VPEPVLPLLSPFNSASPRPVPDPDPLEDPPVVPSPLDDPPSPSSPLLGVSLFPPMLEVGRVSEAAEIASAVALAEDTLSLASATLSSADVVVRLATLTAASSVVVVVESKIPLVDEDEVHENCPFTFKVLVVGITASELDESNIVLEMDVGEDVVSGRNVGDEEEEKSEKVSLVAEPSFCVVSEEIVGEGFCEVEESVGELV
jgi:hypothetical protein